MQPAFLTPNEKSTLEAFVPAVRGLLGDSLVELRLFGSRARGEGGPLSDLDVAVVVKNGARARKNEIYDLAYDIAFPKGIDLAPFVIEQTQLDALRSRERLIAKELDRDGISL